MSNNTIDTTTHPGFIGASVVPEVLNNFIKNICKICNKKEIKYDLALSTHNPRHVYPSGIITLDCKDKLNNSIHNTVTRFPEIMEGIFTERQRSYASTSIKNWDCACLPTDCITQILAGDTYLSTTWIRVKATVIFNPRNSMFYINDRLNITKLHDDFDLDLLDDNWENEGEEHELIDEDTTEEPFIPCYSHLARIAALNTSSFTWNSVKTINLVSEVSKRFINKEQITKIII